MKRTLLILIGLCLLVATSPAAAMISNGIDFTDPIFQPPSGASSHTVLVDGIHLTFEAGVFPVGHATLWWDHIDGFGVQFAYEQDEIEGPEYLKLSFSVPFVLEAVHIADFFDQYHYLERGYYELNGDGNWIEFVATPGEFIHTSSNGERTVWIGETVNYITFTAPGLLQNGENHEYALQGISGTPVPLPPAILLLGSGIFGLAAVRKKMKRC